MRKYDNRIEQIKIEVPWKDVWTFQGWIMMIGLIGWIILDRKSLIFISFI